MDFDTPGGAVLSEHDRGHPAWAAFKRIAATPSYKWRGCYWAMAGMPAAAAHVCC
jgi:hypothetical protein